MEARKERARPSSEGDREPAPVDASAEAWRASGFGRASGRHVGQGQEESCETWLVGAPRTRIPYLQATPHAPGRKRREGERCPGPGP